MSISYRKLDINLSADKETVLVFGQEMSTKYFTEIVVTSMLNGLPALSTGAYAILTSLHAAGLNANDYGHIPERGLRATQRHAERLSVSALRTRKTVSASPLCMQRLKKSPKRPQSVRNVRQTLSVASAVKALHSVCKFTVGWSATN